jgi:hypothetical protein
MDTNMRSAQANGPGIYASGEIENAIRQGRRLRAEAMRNAFTRLRPQLGPVD